MIYQVKLPEQTKDKLGQIVHLQMAILEYAVECKTLQREGLIQHLREKSQFSAHAEQIVDALYGPDKKESQRKRWKQLVTIANCQEGHEFVNGSKEKPSSLKDEKKLVVEYMQADVELLFDPGNDTAFSFYMPSEPDKLPEQFSATRAFMQAQLDAADRKSSKSDSKSCKYPEWLITMKDFLIGFYTNLYGKKGKGGIVGDYFADGQKYGRQNFFKAFSLGNPNQFVCAICDEHSFRTIYESHYLSEIEHYFPKSIYPHLACHPYNLIPLCHECNSIHNDTDPLWNEHDQHRRTLGEVFLPYRKPSISDSAIIYSIPENSEEEARFYTSNNEAEKEIFRKLEVLQDVYRIPNRWHEKNDEIGDHLWRRIRHFLTDDIFATDVLDSPGFLQRRLHRLLAYLSEDRGKDPLTFPTLWQLTQMIVDELDPVLDPDEDLSEEQSAFLQEIRHWIAVDQSRLEELTGISDQLRKQARDARRRLK